MKQILSILAVALFMTACGSQTSDNENSSAAIESSIESAETIPALNPAHGQPHHDCAVSVGAPLAAKKANGEPAEKKVQLNPAHGQPGHRCDIAVGAPLI